jgi:release factor glutamine methyltransferase
VRDHEPRRALFAGDDGLVAIRVLLSSAPAFLETDGLLVFEIGFGQAAAVEREVRARPAWSFLRIEPDLEGIPRVALARRTAHPPTGA